MRDAQFEFFFGKPAKQTTVEETLAEPLRMLRKSVRDGIYHPAAVWACRQVVKELGLTWPTTEDESEEKAESARMIAAILAKRPDFSDFAHALKPLFFRTA